MCQKAYGGLFTVFADFPGEAFKFTRGEPQYFRSSEIATRGFCSKPETEKRNPEESGFLGKMSVPLEVEIDSRARADLAPKR
jgi:hypothetical protein